MITERAITIWRASRAVVAACMLALAIPAAAMAGPPPTVGEMTTFQSRIMCDTLEQQKALFEAYNISNEAFFALYDALRAQRNDMGESLCVSQGGSGLVVSTVEIGPSHCSGGREAIAYAVEIRLPGREPTVWIEHLDCEVGGNVEPSTFTGPRRAA